MDSKQIPVPMHKGNPKALQNVVLEMKIRAEIEEKKPCGNIIYQLTGHRHRK